MIYFGLALVFSCFCNNITCSLFMLIIHWTQLNAVDCNVFNCIWLPNSNGSNSIGCDLFHWVWLVLKSIWFDCQTQSNSIHGLMSNNSQTTWHDLCSSRFIHWIQSNAGHCIVFDCMWLTISVKHDQMSWVSSGV